MQNFSYGISFKWYHMKKILIGLLFVSGHTLSQQLPVIQSVSFKKDTFNISAYGAKADGITLSTLAIKQAIQACPSEWRRYGAYTKRLLADGSADVKRSC